VLLDVGQLDEEKEEKEEKGEREEINPLFLLGAGR